jgi:hypothetical protein
MAQITPAPTKSSTEQRFQRLDHEVADLKQDVAVVKVEVGNMAHAQSVNQIEQTRRFDAIENLFKDNNSRPATIPLNVLMGLGGLILTAAVGFVGLILTAGMAGVAAFWAAVLLLFNPMQASHDSHVHSEGHPATLIRLNATEAGMMENKRDLITATEAVDNRSVQRDREQQRQLDVLAETTKLVEARAIADAEFRGEIKVRGEWARDSLEDLDEWRDTIRGELALTRESVRSLEESRRGAHPHK